MVILFKYLYYLQYPFSILAVYYCFHAPLFLPADFMDEIGLGVLCMGLAFTFASMKEISDISKRDKKVLANDKKYKLIFNYMFLMCFVMFGVSSLFVVQKWLKPNELGLQFFQLGLNCYPLVIALMFMMKQLSDKKKYYDEFLKNEDELKLVNERA